MSSLSPRRESFAGRAAILDAPRATPAPTRLGRAAITRTVREAIARYRRAKEAEEAAGRDAEAYRETDDKDAFDMISEAATLDALEAEDALVRAILMHGGEPDAWRARDAEKRRYHHAGVVYGGALYLAAEYDNMTNIPFGEKLPDSLNVMRLFVVDLARVSRIDEMEGGAL